MVTFYTWVSWISGIIFGLQLLLMLFGGVSHSFDFDIDGDGVPDGHDFSGFKILTLQGLSSFGMGLGFTGLAGLTEFGWNLWVTSLASVAAGFGMLLLMVFVMRQLKKLDETPSRDLSECVGNIGIAYTPFHGKSAGKIEVSLNGRKQIVDAISEGQEDIKSFQYVKVTSLGKDGILRVSSANVPQLVPL